MTNEVTANQPYINLQACMHKILSHFEKGEFNNIYEVISNHILVNITVVFNFLYKKRKTVFWKFFFSESSLRRINYIIPA